MENTMKNYERKRRKEQKEAHRELLQAIHDAVMSKMDLPREFKEKEAEYFKMLN